VPGRLIVQTWKFVDWPKNTPDSILILSFTKKGRKTQIDLKHLNVPQSAKRRIEKGWHDYYWKPWKKYIG